MTRVGDPKLNFLIASLPKDDLEKWLPLLEPIELPLRLVLYESGCALSHVYFPTTAIISLLCVTENGSSAESAVA